MEEEQQKILGKENNPVVATSSNSVCDESVFKVPLPVLQKPLASCDRVGNLFRLFFLFLIEVKISVYLLSSSNKIYTIPQQCVMSYSMFLKFDLSPGI